MSGSAQYTDPDGGTSVLIPIACRFNSDGKPDTSFNTTVFATLTQPTFANSYFTDVELESSGKLLFFGSRKSDFFIVRIQPDGSIDNTFADNGKTITDINDSYDLAHAFIIQPDNKLVGVGQTLVDNVLKPIILRYLPAIFLPAGIYCSGFIAVV